MRALSEKRLSDYMAEQIADEILSGRIEGGSQLKQEELAEVFGASRIPIREAFQVLESQGLIVRLATKRIYTVELDEEQIELIFEMIGEILKKAVQHVLNTKKQTGEKEVFSVETRPDQFLLAQITHFVQMFDIQMDDTLERRLGNCGDASAADMLAQKHAESRSCHRAWFVFVC